MVFRSINLPNHPLVPVPTARRASPLGPAQPMEENMEVEQLKRIADAIEEILRIVKKDMEPRTKKKE